MFLELNTDTTGAAFQLLALAQLNILDCRRDPSLLTWTEDLLSDPLGVLYGRETPDVWTSAAAERFRIQEIAAGRLGRRSHLPESSMCAHRAGVAGVARPRRIRQDCEDIAAEIAAVAFLSGRHESVRVCVTQPHGRGVSHAYNEIDGEIVDGAAFYGMRDRAGNAPPLAWYRQGETVMFDVFEPCPCVVVR